MLSPATEREHRPAPGP